jgi:photosystem II stability/assembly factor-like uncharacterized protein
VYAGGEGGLTKSTDGGQTWGFPDCPTNPNNCYISNSFASQSIRSIAVDPVNPNIIYVGTGQSEDFSVGIYRSIDAGVHWTQFGANEFTTQKVLKIAIDPATAGSTRTTTLYASVVNRGDCGQPGNCTHSIWKSTNSGQTWTQKRTTGGLPGDYDEWTFYDIVIDPNVSSTLYITSPHTAPQSGGVFKSTNGGTDWTVTPIYSLPSSKFPWLLNARKGLRTTTVIYVGYSDPTNHATLARSTDAGSHWMTLPQPHPTPPEGWALFAMDVGHPGTQDTIVAGVGQYTFYSLNSGNTWINSQVPVPSGSPCEGRCYVHADLHSAAFSPSNQLVNYVGSDGGVYRADDSDGGGHGFITWWSKNQNLPGALMQGVSISSDGHLAMGSQDNGIQVMAGPYSGPTPNPPWTFLHQGDGYKPKSFVDAGNITTVYFTNLFYITDCPGPHCTGDYNAAVVRWTHDTWCDITPAGACNEPSQPFPTLFMNSVHPQRIIVGFADLWRSTNSGDIWTQLSSGGMLGGGTVSAVAEANSDTNVIYTVMDKTRVLVTTDSGSTWMPRPAPSPSPGSINAVGVDPCNAKIAYLACNKGVYKTTDYGAHWAIKASGPNAWNDVLVDPGNPSQIFAASAGGVYSGVYWSTNGGETWTNISAGIPPGLGVTSLSFDPTTRKLAASTWGRGAYVQDWSGSPATGCGTQ